MFDLSPVRSNWMRDNAALVKCLPRGNPGMLAVRVLEGFSAADIFIRGTAACQPVPLFRRMIPAITSGGTRCEQG